MRVLMISTDRNILKEGTSVRERMALYGEIVDELHIVVFAKKPPARTDRNVSFGTGGQAPSSKLQAHIAPNVWAYPTNSWSRWFYIHDAINLGKKILSATPPSSKLQAPSAFRWLISTQDPFETGKVGLKLAQQFAVPFQVQVHTDFLSPAFAAQSLLNRIRVYSARRVLARADCIRVVSERIKNSLLQTKNYKLKTIPVVLPVYVDARPFLAENEGQMPISPECDLQKRYPQFRFIILIASRLSPEKNIPLALRTFTRVLNRYPKAGLIIAGEGPERGYLEQFVRAAGIAGNVIFAGFCDRATLVGYYRTANAFLQTSLYEGYGMALIEAALSGTPLVTTDVGIAREFFLDGQSACICPAGDEECLAGGIIRLIEDSSWREALGVNARQAASLRVYPLEEYMRLQKELWEECTKFKM